MAELCRTIQVGELEFNLPRRMVGFSPFQRLHLKRSMVDMMLPWLMLHQWELSEDGRHSRRPSEADKEAANPRRRLGAVPKHGELMGISRGSIGDNGIRCSPNRFNIKYVWD